MPMEGEILPLLSHGILRPQRLHYLDNLRATLTVIVIFHHGAVECGSGYLPAVLWINVNKYALWSLFFFISGYSATLSLATSSSDLRFLVSRTVNVGLAALLYVVLVQKIVFWIINLVWDARWPYVRFSGPISYVSLLLIMDYTHLFIRWINRQLPDAIPSRLKSLVRPNTREKCQSSFGYAFLLLLLFIFCRCLGFQTPSPPLYIEPSNDVPGFDFPFSYVIAYITGVNFDAIKEHINLNISIAYASLLISFVISYGSLGVATQISNSLSTFVHTRDQYLFNNAGLNAHTIFYTLWSTFVLFSIPISLISIFRRASWATREWGFLARHTYAQMYINMVPILVAVHYTAWVADVTLRILLVGGFGVVASWIGMLGCTSETVINFLRHG